MAEIGEFYGHTLIREGRALVSDQLYEALRHEILRGRWKVGERIPGFKEILAQTGLSQNALLRALDLLEAGGYVERIRHKGVYVKATATPGNRSLGVVAILVPDDAPVEPGYNEVSVMTRSFGQIAVASLSHAADKLGLQTRIVEAPAEPSGLAQNMPHDDVFGVISLFPFEQTRTLLGSRLAERVIYLGASDPRARPCLAGEPFLAAHCVIEELLAFGHRRIAFIPSPACSPTTDSRVRQGIAAALHGTDAELLELAESDACPPQTTAVFAFGIEGARRCIRAAEAAGRSVPEDLSVASLHTGILSEHGRWTSGAVYEWHEILATCFELLISPDKALPRSVAKLVFQPSVHNGDTLVSCEANSDRWVVDDFGC